MTVANRFVVSVPASSVCARQPTHEYRQILIVHGIHDKMPVVGHEAVSKDSHGIFFHPFLEYSLKSFVVFFFAKDPLPTVGSVENMVYHITSSHPWISCHRKSISEYRLR